MNNNPLVSVAVCVYNGERFLKLQLDSILNQDYKNLELIIVDDGSTDGSGEILQSYAERYDQVKVYFNTANLGYVKNFEKAISLSNGKYIALSDHDDIWYPEKISKQVAAIGDHLLIYHDSEYIDEKGNSLDLKMSQLLNLYEGNSPLPFVLKNCVSGHTILFDRMLIEHALPFNAAFFHDWWLAFVAANLGSIKHLPEILVKYRQHANNTIDMLNLKPDAQQEETFYNPLVIDKEWIRHCSSYNGLHTTLIARIYYLISNISPLNKLKLYFLLYRKKRLFYAINKGGKKHKLKLLKTMVFSLTAKN